MANYDEKKKLREKERQKAQKKQNRKWKQATGTEGVTASYWLLAPLIAVFAVVPLAMYMYEFDSKLDGFDWYNSENIQRDVFLHCKMVLLIIIAVYMVGALIYNSLILKQKLLYTKMMIPLALYGILTFISAILSENSYFSFFGIQDHFESVWVLLTYCLIVYYTYNVLRSEQSISKLMKWLVIGMAVMLSLGVAQGLGCDPMRSETFRNMLGMHGSASFDVEENRVYFSLSNPNYAGVYTVMIMPILTAVFLSVRKLWQKVILGILIAADIFALYMSSSTAGILAFICLLLVYGILYRRTLFKNWKLCLAGVGLLVIIFVGMNVYKQSNVLDKIKASLSVEEAVPALQSIETKKDCVRIVYNDQAVNFSMGKNQQGEMEIKAVRDDGTALESIFNEDDGCYYIQDENIPLSYGFVQTEDFYGFGVNINGMQWVFSNALKENDTSYYVYFGGKAVKLKNNTGQYNKFLGRHGMIATGRGFLWSRTLPLLTQYFWLGSGPDTFIIAYPNDDLVAKANMGFIDYYVSKPHSLYLQIAVQTGVPSLICLLIFLGWYLIDSLRLYWKMQIKGFLPALGVASMISVIGFMVTGLTNDSLVGLTSVFYLIVGMGMAINNVIRGKSVTTE